MFFRWKIYYFLGYLLASAAWIHFFSPDASGLACASLSDTPRAHYRLYGSLDHGWWVLTSNGRVVFNSQFNVPSLADKWIFVGIPEILIRSDCGWIELGTTLNLTLLPRNLIVLHVITITMWRIPWGVPDGFLFYPVCVWMWVNRGCISLHALLYPLLPLLGNMIGYFGTGKLGWWFCSWWWCDITGNALCWVVMGRTTAGISLSDMQTVWLYLRSYLFRSGFFLSLISYVHGNRKSFWTYLVFPLLLRCVSIVWQLCDGDYLWLWLTLGFFFCKISWFGIWPAAAVPQFVFSASALFHGSAYVKMHFRWSFLLFPYFSRLVVLIYLAFLFPYRRRIVITRYQCSLVDILFLSLSTSTSNDSLTLMNELIVTHGNDN